MAAFIKTNGIVSGVQPMNKHDFKLKELQDFVGGYIEIVHLQENDMVKYNDLVMVVNEEGLMHRLEYNLIASQIVGQDIVGDVLVCKSSEVQ